MTEPKNPGCRNCTWYEFVGSNFYFTRPGWIFHRCKCSEYKVINFSPLDGQYLKPIDCKDINSRGGCKQFAQKPAEKKVSWWKRLFKCGG